jgi:L-lactate utilization protein LutC
LVSKKDLKKRRKMKSDREIIFENIRKSLGNSRIEIANDSLLDGEIDEKLNLITPTSQNGLVDQFKSELEKVDAEFIDINDIKKLSSALQKLLNDNEVNKIAVSDDTIINEISDSLIGIEIKKATKHEYSERKSKISQIETALVFAENGIADIGSVVFYYDITKTTYPHFLCDWTVIVIKRNSIVANQFELMKNIDIKKAKNMVFATGPSRTADIEKTLVLGAHGPRRVTVVLIPEN